MTTEEFSLKTILDELSLPTLEDISVMALAIGLLQKEEVKKVYYQLFSPKKCIWPRMSEDKVRKLTSLCKSLHLPNVLKSKLMSVFHWIANQYYDWIRFVLENVPQLEKAFPKEKDFVTHIMNSVKWSKGVIDKEKSIHQVFLLKNIQDDVIFRQMFRTASIFCLKDDLAILWEKMSDSAKSKAFLNKKGETCFLTLYWICKIKLNMKDFTKHILNYLKQNYCKTLKAYKGPKAEAQEANHYALVLYSFEGDISGLKYFNELANVDVQDKLQVINIFLKRQHFINVYEQPEKLIFLLRDIEDEGIFNKLLHKFSKEFLEISIKHWTWHKFFLTFLRICSGSSDVDFVYTLITRSLGDTQIEKPDMFQTKKLWKEFPSEVRKSFCSYISNKHPVGFISGFWANVTIEEFDMFLKDQELKNILMPHENYGLLECVLAGRYELIDHWLEKCLVSKEAIISYSENFIQTKFVAVLKRIRWRLLPTVNKFLDWAFKHEDLMNKNIIFKIKDQAINRDIIALFINGFKHKEFEDLKKLIDWMVRNREHDYENELLSWKKKAVQEIFSRSDLESIRNYVKSCLLPFFSYGVNDSEKTKVLMNEFNV